MRIDSAWHHEVSAGLHDPCAGPRRETGADLRDALSHDANVGKPAGVGVDHLAAPHEQLGYLLRVRSLDGTDAWIRSGTEDGGPTDGQAGGSSSDSADCISAIHDRRGPVR